MTSDELKKSIIKYCISGCLKLSSKEDVSITETLKNSDVSFTEIDKEDYPYEIPEGWIFVHLGDLASFSGGFAFKSTEYKKEGVRVIRISDFDEYGFVDKDIKRYEDSSSLNDCIIKEKDILMCMTGGTVGKSCYITSVPEKMVINQRVAKISVVGCLNSKYVYYVLNSPNILNIINGNKTSTNDNISMPTIKSFLIPLPPVEEQKRIVDAIDDILPLVEQYKITFNTMAENNKNFKELLKLSILKRAFEGGFSKETDDESAQVIVETIKKEKYELAKQKLYKKEATDVYILEDQSGIPFSNWCATNIGSLIILTSGNDLTPNDYSKDNIGVPYFTGASNIDTNGELIINRYTDKKHINCDSGEILFSCKGTIGKMATNNVGPCHIARQFMGIKTFINPDFTKYYLMSIVGVLMKKAKSMIPGIDRNTLLNAQIFLPPEKEQERIVRILDSSLSEVDKLFN